MPSPYEQKILIHCSLNNEIGLKVIGSFIDSILTERKHEKVKVDGFERVVLYTNEYLIYGCNGWVPIEYVSRSVVDELNVYNVDTGDYKFQSITNYNVGDVVDCGLFRNEFIKDAIRPSNYNIKYKSIPLTPEFGHVIALYINSGMSTCGSMCLKSCDEVRDWCKLMKVIYFDDGLITINNQPLASLFRKIAKPGIPIELYSAPLSCVKSFISTLRSKPSLECGLNILKSRLVDEIRPQHVLTTEEIKYNKKSYSFGGVESYLVDGIIKMV